MSLEFLDAIVFAVVTALPASSGSGAVVRLSTDGELYEDTTGGWRRVRTAPGTGGSSLTTISVKSAAYTALGTVDEVVLANAASAPLTITLPTAVRADGLSVQVSVKRTDSSANTLTVATTAGQTIDGTSFKTISRQYDSLTVVSDGANWAVI